MCVLCFDNPQVVAHCFVCRALFTPELPQKSVTPLVAILSIPFFLSWVSYTSVQQLCNNCVAHLPQRTLNIRCTRQKVARHRGISSSLFLSLASSTLTHTIFLLFLCFMITERRTGVAHCARAFTTNNNNVLHLGFYFVLTLIYGVDGGGSAPDAGTHLPP